MLSHGKRRVHSRRGAPWSVGELKRLGRTADSRLARLRRRTIKEVVAQRTARRLGVETGPRRWTAREIRLLGKFNDHELARRLSRRLSEVRQQRLLNDTIGMWSNWPY
ncbi:MAG: hypothetical protein C5B50_25975 [Verrucomicrobia bacterium]|nr:MAG: hypothetical protein C5B50_25975 [Verrucomicrobiota bacterium]